MMCWLPLVVVRGDAGGPAGPWRSEAPGEGSRQVEVEEDAVAAATEAASVAPALAPTGGPPPLWLPRRHRLLLNLLARQPAGGRRLRLLSLGVCVGPGLLDEVSEGELVL
jgi:hypothetical protein